MKNGLEYFPLDTNFFEDDKVALVEVDHGFLGSNVLLRIISKIYKTEGYYCKWGEDERKLFTKRNGGNEFDLKKLDAIVESGFHRNFFDRAMYEKYNILTSHGIQKRYFEALSRRQLKAYREYILIPEINITFPNVKLISLTENEPITTGENNEDKKAGEDIKQSTENNSNPPDTKEEQPQSDNKDNKDINKPLKVPAQTEETKNSSSNLPEATITRKNKPKNQRKFDDELIILAYFFFKRKFLKPEKELDKFICHNELIHSREGGWSKMSSTTRIAASKVWEQMDSNKNIIKEVRFSKDKLEFLAAWEKLFNVFAYELNAPEDILTDMVRDNIKWENYSEYQGRVRNNLLHASESLVNYLRENVKTVQPILQPILKGKPFNYIIVPDSETDSSQT